MTRTGTRARSPARSPARFPAGGRAWHLVAALVTVLVVVLVGVLTGSDQARPTYHHYVALGDSYTAAPFVPVTDIADGCYRSSNNYPSLVAAALHVDDLEDRSCSGAQSRDLTGRQRKPGGASIAPQLTALSGRTDLVTVGIGANDGRLYARIATLCRLRPSACRLADERPRLSSILDRLRPALVTTLTEIKTRAPRARVLLIGYPKLLPPHGDCSRLPRMRPQDRAAFREVNLRLRREMGSAAADAGVEFVDFYAASLGHDVCAREPWVQGRLGSSRRGAALHPLAAGQAALAALVEKTLRRPAPSGHS